VFVALGLAACATRGPATDSPLTSGRLSLRVEAEAGRSAQSLSAGFELQGDGGQGELRLLSPLGTQLASARWAPGLAELRTPEGVARFESLDELSQRALGERLPLAALPDWLAGRPWPGAPYLAQADGFEQLGWQVGLARLAEGAIDARREAPPAVSLRVRLDRPAP
jgi:outer membrane lipoprotein LolB